MGHSVIENQAELGLNWKDKCVCCLSRTPLAVRTTFIKLSWVKLSEHLKQNNSEQASNIGFKERVCVCGGEGEGATDSKSWKQKIKNKNPTKL